MEVTKHDPGVPAWVDLATDLVKSKPFYSGLLGWDCAEGTEDTGFYSLASLRGKSVAGLAAQRDMPSVWTTYVAVESADETAAKVEAAGGEVVMAPIDVLEYGRMGLFKDPAGAFFAVWQPGAHKGAEIVNEPGTFCWSELLTDDADRSKAFYAAVFGWGAKTHTGGPVEYTEWRIGDRSVGGMMPKSPMMPAEVPNHWGVYFAVEDLDVALSKVAELGGRVLTGPVDSPAGMLAVCTDSHGAGFNIIKLSGNAPG